MYSPQTIGPERSRRAITVNKKLKFFHKSISIITGLFLVLQSLAPGFFALQNSVFAQEETPAVVEEVSPSPVEETTPTPEETIASTPEETTNPTVEVSPEATPEPTI